MLHSQSTKNNLMFLENRLIQIFGYCIQKVHKHDAKDGLACFHPQAQASGAMDVDDSDREENVDTDEPTAPARKSRESGAYH